jgi:hypothetical protein
MNDDSKHSATSDIQYQLEMNLFQQSASPDAEAGYENFLRDQERVKREQAHAIGLPIGAHAEVLLRAGKRLSGRLLIADNGPRGVVLKIGKERFAPVDILSAVKIDEFSCNNL